jgi:predicted ArsR family transcriptional regulator
MTKVYPSRSCIKAGVADNPSPAGRRDEILRILAAVPVPIGVAEIAGRLRVHPNTVRFHLDNLMRSGHAERVAVRAVGPGRPPALFRAVPAAAVREPRDYRLLADVLLADIVADGDPVTRAKRAGRRWGRRILGPPGGPGTPVKATEVLVRELDRVGFAPRPADHGRTVDLDNCPFLDAVHTHGRIVCDLHLGFVEGMLGRLGSQAATVELVPFVRPGQCRLSLTSPHDEPSAAR